MSTLNTNLEREILEFWQPRLKKEQNFIYIRMLQFLAARPNGQFVLMYENDIKTDNIHSSIAFKEHLPIFRQRVGILRHVETQFSVNCNPLYFPIVVVHHSKSGQTVRFVIRKHHDPSFAFTYQHILHPQLYVGVDYFASKYGLDYIHHNPLMKDDP